MCITYDAISSILGIGPKEIDTYVHQKHVLESSQQGLPLWHSG